MKKMFLPNHNRVAFLRKNIQYHEDCLSMIGTEDFYKHHRLKKDERESELIEILYDPTVKGELNEST